MDFSGAKNEFEELVSIIKPMNKVEIISIGSVIRSLLSINVNNVDDYLPHKEKPYTFDDIVYCLSNILNNFEPDEAFMLFNRICICAASIKLHTSMMNNYYKL